MAALMDVFDGTVSSHPDGEKIQKLAESCNSPEALFVKTLFWRYIPIPLTDLNLVDTIESSDFSYLHKEKKHFAEAMILFEIDLKRRMKSGKRESYLSMLWASSKAAKFRVDVEYCGCGCG